jgi:hypothetical protein
MPEFAPTAGTSPAPGLLRRCWGPAAVVVAANVVAACQPYSNGPPIRSDGYGYHAWTYPLLHGSVNFVGLPNDTYAFHETRPGYFWNVYPPGVALARLPVMAFIARGDPYGAPTIAEHVAVVILSALALIATAFLLFSTCRNCGAGPTASNVAVVAVVFGTGLFHYAMYDCSYSHVWTAFGFTALMALGVRARRNHIPPAALIALAAWLMLVRNTNVFAMGVLGAAYLCLAPRRIGVPLRTALRNTSRLAVGTVLGIIIQLALNSHAYGRFALSSYPGELFYWDRPMQWSVLTSVAEHGLFPYYPFAALLIGLPLTVRRLWPAATAFVAIIAIYVTLYGYWNMWNLGASFGHRGFVDVLPLGVPLFAIAFDQLPRWPRLLVMAATAACIYVTVNLMAGYWRDSLPYHNITPAMYRGHLIGREQLLAKVFVRN